MFIKRFYYLSKSFALTQTHNYKAQIKNKTVLLIKNFNIYRIVCFFKCICICIVRDL